MQQPGDKNAVQTVPYSALVSVPYMNFLSIWFLSIPPEVEGITLPK